MKKILKKEKFPTFEQEKIVKKAKVPEAKPEKIIKPWKPVKAVKKEKFSAPAVKKEKPAMAVKRYKFPSLPMPPPAKKENPVYFKKQKLPEIKPENPVYLRLRYSEAVNSKKDLLFMESSLLTVLKIIKKYNLWRTEELRIKLELYKALKDLNSSVKKTKSVFPFLEIPENIRRRELERMEQEEEIMPAKEIFDEGLESQLRDIQERLRLLGA